nr:hypothetical protein MACL_00000554 [Theileria orientalis]
MIKSPKFIQADPSINKDTEPSLFSLLFHPPVHNRAMDIGLEDSNQGTMNAIKMNEEEDDINKMLDDIEKNEQDQVDSFYETFELQNAQLKEISKLF